LGAHHTGTSLELLDLLWGQGHVITGGEILGQINGAHFVPDQADYLAAEMLEDAPDQAISAFIDSDKVPVAVTRPEIHPVRIGQLDLADGAVFQDQSGTNLVFLSLTEARVHHTVVTAGNLKARVCQVMDKFAVIGQEQQAFSPEIEAPHCEQLKAQIAEAGQVKDGRHPVIATVTSQAFIGLIKQPVY
jgi:hypothetical protein